MTTDAGPPAPAPGAGEFPGWLERVAALAAQGLAYTTSPYDRERFGRLRDLVVEAGRDWGGAALAAALGSVIVEEQGYWTPKIEVRVGIVAGDRLLMVQERDDQGWSLPGGWLDVGYGPCDGARKELLEETGLQVGNLELLAAEEHAALGCQPGYPWHVVKMVYRGTADHEAVPRPRDLHEIAACTWVPFDQIAQRRLSSHRTSPAMIDLVAHAAPPPGRD